MFEMNLIEIASSLGGFGGFIAVICIAIYRADRKSSENKIREDRKFMEDRLTKILEQDIESREQNTKALTELTTFLMRKNGH